MIHSLPSTRSGTTFCNQTLSLQNLAYALFGDNPHLMSILSLLHTTLLVGYFLMYVVFIIIAYRIRLLEPPKETKRKHGFKCCKFHHSRKKTRWMFKHRPVNFRKKRSVNCEHMCACCPSNFAFTSILNTDNRRAGRGSTHFDSYSSTMVCDNSDNIQVCNNLSIYVGPFKRFQITRLLLLEQKSTCRQELVLFDGRGEMSIQSGTSTSLIMCYSS